MIASLHPWLGLPPPLLYGGLAVVALIVLVGLWLLFGPGPRRARAHRRALRLLHEGKWQEALSIVRSLQAGRLSAAWQGKLRNAEGECHHTAADMALLVKSYEDSLQHYEAAAGLLNLDAAELKARVLEAMLAEVRRLVSAGETDAALQLAARAGVLQSPCPEAAFWQALCHVQGGRLEAALSALASCQEDGGKRFLDPPLYLGTLLVRAGRVQEGLRYLSEANRLDPSCPFVTWQLGSAIVAGGGDSGLAARALQRALGPRGLTLWVKSPEKAWIEGLPEGRSYVRRLAMKHAFVCPVFGGDVAVMVRQAQLALAQAQYRLGSFPDAADLYTKLLQDSPPSVPLLRGLGLSLARLEKYDQAYKHLRAALEMEEPKDVLTAGYLALCGAMGRPIKAEDKAKNVQWAVGLLARFQAPGNVEFARVSSAVFAEARKIGLALPVEEQVRLCDTLVSVDAADPAAAAAYAQLVDTSAEAVRPEYAWLYCRAAQQHGFHSDQDLALFGRTFRDQAAARAFYAQRQWDLDAVAFTYLERCAANRPGHFPEEFGPDYPAHGEAMLLERSAKQEAAGQKDAALATADVLLKLAPQSAKAHDRLAQLHYRRGDLDRAAELLGAWQALERANSTPAVRRAIVEQQRGNTAGRDQAVRLALELTEGRRRAEVAFLGARLAVAAADTDQARELLHQCLREAPDHAGALSCLAAVCSASGDQPGLVSLAPAMNRPDVKDGRFQYLAAVCHLAAGNASQVLEAGRRAAALTDGPLAVESEYLAGWAHLRLHDAPAAAAVFQKVATANSPSADQARAVLAHLSFGRGDFADAVHWWNAIDASKRSEWRLDEPLRQTVFLSALEAYRQENYEQAADLFREAGRLGLRDRRLGPLLVLSLVLAGRRQLYGEAGRETTSNPAALLERAVQAGSRDSNVSYLLALAHKRQGKTAEARAALRKITPPDANVFLQLGLLSLRDGQPAQAEQEFAKAFELDPTSYEACHNLLLTRLTLNQVDAAAVLVPKAAELAASPDEQRFLGILQSLLRGSGGSNGDLRFDPALLEATAEDEQRILQLLRSLGQPDIALTLAQTLAAVRPGSTSAQEAYLEVVLAKAKELVDRCAWGEAERLLAGIVRAKPTVSAAARPAMAAVYNLLGCCACLTQDFEHGADHFTAALRHSGKDARIYQNLALAHELQNDLAEAEKYWGQYFDLIDGRLPAAPGQKNYSDVLAYEGLARLAGRFTEKERWPSALRHMQRAAQLRPQDTETLERLFHLYNQAKRPDEARKTLRRLRELRPHEPQYDLYEIDLVEVKGLGDIERMLGDIDRILKRYPNDARVEEKAVGMVGSVIPMMGNLCDQLTDQMSKVIDQVRHLPNYQINWSAVHEVMRDLLKEFQRLRRITTKCLPLVTNEDHRRIVRDLMDHIDRKIEVCRSMGG